MASHPSGQPLRVGQALERSEGFVGLMQRLEQSRRCYAALEPLVPAELYRAVRPGPMKEDGWSLLVDNAAAAAKLRQMVPDLLRALTARGLQCPALRVKVNPRR